MKEIFEKVQKLLYENKVNKTCGTKCSSNSLIAGLIFDNKDTPEPNPYLVNAIVKSFYYHKQIQSGKTIEDLQTEEGLKDSKYIRNILNIKYISPELTEQILTGTQPRKLSLQKLIIFYT